MSAKNRDNKNRWRNITVGFRVSPEENESSGLRIWECGLWFWNCRLRLWTYL